MHEIDTLGPSSSSPFGAAFSSKQPHQHPASSSSPALRNMPHLSDDPFADLRTPKAAPPPPPAAKGRAPAALPPSKAAVDKRYNDPWADILEDPDAAAAKKSKSTKAGKGKGKEKEVDVGGGGGGGGGREGRKRSLSTAAYEEDEGTTANAKRGKVRPWISPHLLRPS